MILKQKISKYVYVPVLIVAILLSFFVFITFLPEGANALGFTPFGGQILNVFYGCVNGVMITVGPPRGGTFMYSGGTLYKYGQIYRTGPWTLGDYIPSGSCVVCGYGCYSIPTTGTINQVGTSI